ncbi:hypothetical protein EV383_2303 [Pseudonocardia sediminis]|uniref:Alpha/beta hydrolase family protein DUF900 n=1 Tax=Pseudonocardia sediminis TaxID=1397368 RepID=A0A4Q7UWQ6_PSEST|nr:hypothetical protein [Pseudonocardia sediminis]RZT85438.1 hypothetical protein EV383_2303 [Pseudonocardia sediminis]
MSDRLAVLFVHGVEASDGDVATTAMRLLCEEFTAHTGVDADDALVVRSAHWVPVLQQRQDDLERRLTGEGETLGWFLDGLRWAGGVASRGSLAALSALVASGAVRWLPGAGDFRWPTLRWLAVGYIGDAIAYQRSNAAVYGGVHAVLAQSLRELAREAGPDARLCVVAHSLGTVVVSNYFHDVHAGAGLPEQVAEIVGDTPLERGRTLSRLHTLGSPLALFTLGLDEHQLDTPLRVPHPDVEPDLDGRGGWTNLYDPDDVIATPLAGLSPHYRDAVADERVGTRPFPFNLSPLAHTLYWNDRHVMRGIAETLAGVWAA